MSSDVALDKINIHVYNPTGQSVYYEYTKEGELVGLSNLFIYLMMFLKGCG